MKQPHYQDPEYLPIMNIVRLDWTKDPIGTYICANCRTYFFVKELGKCWCPNCDHLKYESDGVLLVDPVEAVVMGSLGWQDKLPVRRLQESHARHP